MNGLVYWSFIIAMVLWLGDAIYIQGIRNLVVVQPTFTYSAYQPNGFYYHFNGKCKDCLTVYLSDDLSNLTQKYGGSFNAGIIAVMMGYKLTSDEELTLHPQDFNRSQFIVLHNEYVSQTEFNLINSSQSPIYFYPNALYGNVTYANRCQITNCFPDRSTITLMGDIQHKTNAFGWTLDNTRYEKTFCPDSPQLQKNGNGYFFNCWTQDPIQIFKELFYLEFKRT